MEKWKEIYTDEQITHIQAIELKNLDVIQEVCNKIGIQFFAYGGTLIGVVRHKGFVPWDDDLDVAMFREDYIKFLNEAPKYLPKEYVLQTPYNEPKTPYPYTKLRLQGTKCVEYGNHKLDIEHGIYVDIYPIDNLPDDESVYLKAFKKYQQLTKIYAWRQCPYLSNTDKTVKIAIKKAVKFIVSFLLRFIPQEYLIKQIDKVATQFNGLETQRKGNLNFPEPKNYFYNILPLEEGELNGRKIMLPGGWNEHLISRYDNYMELPPEEERVGHKPYILEFGKY